MPLVSPINRDLAVNGGGLVAVGLGGLVAASVVIKGGPALAIVPWIIVALVLGLAQVVVGGGWLRNAVADAPAAEPGLVPEDSGAAVRRLGLPIAIAFVLVVLALFVAPQFASLLAGLAFGAGATDLRSRNWIRAAEASDGVVILREASALPFATSRKRLWALPRPTATS